MLCITIPMIPTTIILCTSACILAYLHRSITRGKARALSSTIPSAPNALPIVGHLFELDPKRAYTIFDTWAWQLGPIYKFSVFGTTAIVVSDFDSVVDILRKRPTLFARSENVRTVFEEEGWNGLFSDEGEAWKSSRQLIAPAFTTSRIMDTRATIVKATLRVRKSLHEVAKKQEARLAEWFPTGGGKRAVTFKPDPLFVLSTPFNKPALTAVLEIAISHGHDELVEELDIDELTIFLQRMGERGRAPFPYWRIPFLRTHNDEVLTRASGMLRGLIHKCISMQAAPTAGASPERLISQTMLRAILLSGDTHALKRDKSVVGNMGNIILGGFETTATTIHWALYHLAKDKRVQHKVHEEIDRVLAAFDTDSVDELSKLDGTSFPYLTNVIRESMRLSPIGPINPVAALQDTTILGHFVPKGTTIFLAMRVASMRSCPTKDPFKFCPERWEGLDDETYKAQMTNFLGFGGGPRVCPGMRLAMLEMTLMLAIGVFNNFEVDLAPTPPGYAPVLEVSGLTNYPENLFLQVSERKK